MSKLWKVEVTIETTGYAIVFADTEADAEKIARNNAHEIADDSDTDASASEIDNASDLPYGWGEHDTPYGAEHTIATLIEMAAGDPPPFRDVYTIDMFAGAPA